MITVDQLQTFGANTKEGLGRCFGNEALYLRLIGKMVESKEFEQLKEALENKDYEKAFSAAHGLKGALGNLSLTPLYEPVLKMTDLLRARTEMDYSGMLSDILEKREELRALCED